MTVAFFDHYFWSSFHIDTNGVIHFWVVHSDDRSLEVAVKGDVGEHSAILHGHLVVYCNLSLLKPSDERDFGALANRLIERVLGHFNVSLRIPNNAFNNSLDHSGVEIAIEESIQAAVLHIDALGVEVYDFHLFSGHGAGFAKAKISDETDLLN